MKRADAVGWVPFFLIATAASVPALVLLARIMRREARKAIDGSPLIAASKN